MAASNLIAAHLDHSRSYDDFLYVYPVISRRSQGLSIGINLNPDKVCNSHCIYCEVDHLTLPRRKEVDLDVLARELRDMLRIYQDGTLFEREPFASVPTEWRKLKNIAFSGEGEPTTCPTFDHAVQVAWNVRKELDMEAVKLLLITNASCLDRDAVMRGIRCMQDGQHEVWAKLDAGTKGYYQTVNRCHVPFSWILRNITKTATWCPLVIQSLFLRVSGKTPARSEIQAYAGRLNDIQEQGGIIKGVQLYTVARPTTMSWATALSDEELNGIAALVHGLTDLPLQIFHGNFA